MYIMAYNYLTYSKVIQVREEYRAGNRTKKELGEIHGIPTGQISKVIQGEPPYDIMAMTEHLYHNCTKKAQTDTQTRSWATFKENKAQTS